MSDASLPTVDVVMIAFNKEATIAEAIRGVMKQKGRFKLRLIIMDDCSTDRTAQIASEWADRYPDKILYIRNPHNLGLQGNYLEGFRHCTGRYLAICDADDYWFSSRKLARQVGYMETHPQCGLTFHRVVNLYEHSGEMSLSNGGQAADTTIADLARGNYITNLSVVYRRSLVDLSNLPAWIADDRAPDYAFHMLYASHGSIHYFARPMGVYRQSAAGNWSMADRFERLKMSLMVRLNLITELAHHPEAVTGLKAASTNILRAMQQCADTPERRDFISDQAARLDITLPDEPTPPAASPRRRPLLTRIRATISRLIPRPKP